MELTRTKLELDAGQWSQDEIRGENELAG